MQTFEDQAKDRATDVIRKSNEIAMTRVREFVARFHEIERYEKSIHQSESSEPIERAPIPTIAA